MRLPPSPSSDSFSFAAVATASARLEGSTAWRGESIGGSAPPAPSAAPPPVLPPSAIALPAAVVAGAPAQPPDALAAVGTAPLAADVPVSGRRDPPAVPTPRREVVARWSADVALRPWPSRSPT